MNIGGSEQALSCFSVAHSCKNSRLIGAPASDDGPICQKLEQHHSAMEAFVHDDLDLEDPNGARSQALVAEGNAEVARRLHDDLFEADRHRLRAIIEDDDKLFLCRRRGAWIYDFHRNAEHPRGLWRRLPEHLTPSPDADWEPVFDLDAYCHETGREWAWRGPVDRPDSARVMMMFSDDGSDNLVGREFDLSAKTFVAGGFETPLARQSLAWDGPDALLLSAATGPEHATRSGWPRTVREWRRGRPAPQAARPS